MDHQPMPVIENLPDVRRIHFVGIGGSGMSPLAEILHAQGYDITGSDDMESDNVTRIRSLGIPVSIPLGTGPADQAQLVVYTAAISQQCPELIAAKEKGIPIIERGKMLGLVSKQFANTVAVAGTHGKTTTTSMIAQILLEADLDPSLFIGGRLPLINANGRAGKTQTMVCEACEFKNHYLEMTPAISIILNVDADHLDFFGSLENVIASFHQFALQTRSTLIVNAEDANTLKAVAGIQNRQILRFGLNDSCDWSARNITYIDGSYPCYDLYHHGVFVCPIRLGVPGNHNVLNSLAAAAAADLCGATPEQIAHGLESFHGAGRRFEFLGTFHGVTIADDYAHHPTEITATLKAAKAMPYHKVWAVFQPFTFSRTARHLEDFAQSLALADHVVVSDIMGSREVNEWNVSSSQITDRIPGARYIPDFEGISRFVSQNAEENDLVVTMGGGNIYMCARMIRDRLKEK